MVPASFAPPFDAAWQPILTLLLAAAAIMGSPGPSTISVTAVGATYGFRRSLCYATGLIVGTTAVLLAVALGVIAILASIPHGASVLVAVSAVYILYLAWKIATAPPLSASSGGVAPSFCGGLLLAIANPKAWLAIAAVFAGSTIVEANRLLDAAIKVALLTAMIVVIHFGWLVAGGMLARVLRQPAHARMMNVALALVLILATVLALRE